MGGATISWNCKAEGNVGGDLGAILEFLRLFFFFDPQFAVDFV